MEVPNTPPSSGVPPNICPNSCSGDTGTRGEEGWRERRMQSGARTLPFLLGQLFSRPPSQPIPLPPERTPNKSTGRGDKEAAGEERPEQCGAGPSQTPEDRAGERASPEIAAELRPRGPRPSGPAADSVTRTRGSTGGQDGAARSGAERPPERAWAGRRRDSPAFWSRGQR